MRFAVISSGSKANCTFIEGANTRILIDCGLSATETVRRLVALGISPDSLDAVIVTHEHSDHITGIPVLSRKLKIPVFANRATAVHIAGCYAVEHFITGETFWVGGLRINPFSIPHDASDPVGFTVHAEGLKFAQATDLGRVTPLVRESLRDAHGLVLESNHDEQLLRDCGYPWVLKQRIASSHGHLSNETAAALLSEVLHAGLSEVVLGHLSENSNRPDVALETARRYVAQEQLWSLQCGTVMQSTQLLTLGEREASQQAG